MCGADAPGDEAEGAPYGGFLAWLRRLWNRSAATPPQATGAPEKLADLPTTSAS